MAYSDYLAQNAPGYQPPGRLDSSGATASGGTSTSGASNLAMNGIDGSGVSSFFSDMFGKAKDVDNPSPDWSTTQYGGNEAAANQNQSMLYGTGDQNYTSDLNTGRSLYAQQSGQATGSAAAGQWNAAQGTGYTQSGIGAQQQASAGIGNWLAQGPGPSVAQAQLQQGNNQNVANMMAMAASGRGQGGGAAAQQAAAFQAANAGQQTNEQAAILRAQEAQNWRQAQLGGMQAQANIGSSIAGAGQNQQNLGLNYQQLAANQQQNAGSTMLNAMNMGQSNQQGFYNMGQQQLANQTQAASSLEQARMNDLVQAQQANQQSTYQHQSGVTGLLGAAAGALAFL